MHYGTVNRHLEPGVDLTVLGTDNRTYQGEFIIDTGYSGEIILPLYTVGEPYLVKDDDISRTLGGDMTDDYATYNAWIEWHGQYRDVAVTNVGSEVLIGMSLFQGSNLSVDAAPDVQVIIAELPIQA